MPIWKDASYFDSPSKDVGNVEPKSAADDQKQVEDGPDNENDEKDKSEDDSSPKEVNTAGQHIEPTSIAKALSDSSWVEAMQEELCKSNSKGFGKQFEDLPNWEDAIGTKWVLPKQER
ncbi:hypothetical protein Tco_1568153 [Tanacetum coccineum]